MSGFCICNLNRKQRVFSNPQKKSLDEIRRIFNLIFHKVVLEVSIMLFLLFYSSSQAIKANNVELRHHRQYAG